MPSAVTTEPPPDRKTKPMTPAGPPAVILNSRTHVMHSAAVDDDYQLDIWLPDGYHDSSQRYPVLYVLDSPGWFGMVCATVMTQIWEELLPELIVVGVGKPMQTLDEWWPVRSRDYSPRPLPGEEGSGRSDAFHQALRHEILPAIDATYRTDTADRTLWGHSLGGLFALRTLLNASGLFHRFIATSPAVSLDGQILLDLAVDSPPAGSNLPGRLFVSVGTLDKEFGASIEAFNAELRLRHYQGLHVDSVELPGYGHSSAAPPGFLIGLQSVFPNAAL